MHERQERYSIEKNFTGEKSRSRASFVSCVRLDKDTVRKIVRGCEA
jgi:hypothetical protein